MDELFLQLIAELVLLAEDDDPAFADGDGKITQHLVGIGRFQQVINDIGCGIFSPITGVTSSKSKFKSRAPLFFSGPTFLLLVVASSMRPSGGKWESTSSVALGAMVVNVLGSRTNVTKPAEDSKYGDANALLSCLADLIFGGDKVFMSSKYVTHDITQSPSGWTRHLVRGPCRRGLVD